MSCSIKVFTRITIDQCLLERL